MLTKITTALCLGILLLFSPVSTLVAAPAPLEMQQADEVDNETLLIIADALEDMDWCTANEAMQWYKIGTLQITYLGGSEYQVTMPSGAITILDVDML